MEKFSALGFSDHETRMLADAYQAVTKAEMWEYLKLSSTPGKDGFMFSKDIELALITAEMTHGHSGASFAWVMRQMEAIAKGGWAGWANRMRYLRSMQQLRHEEELCKMRAHHH
jgi:hypothetical protein